MTSPESRPRVEWEAELTEADLLKVIELAGKNFPSVVSACRELLGRRHEASRLTAEVERLRKIIATDAIRFDILAGRARACEKGAISEGHPLSVQEGEWWAEDCRAALALPTTAPEAKE